MRDHQTLDFYDQHAAAYIEQTREVKMADLYDSFVNTLPNPLAGPHCILDVGCGSGRDSFWFFNNLTRSVTAIDGSAELIKRNQIYYELSAINWLTLRFEDIKNQGWEKLFTGIWACASLLHVPFDELPTLMIDLINTLASGGVMYASFKYGDSDRWDGSRFFCDMNEDRWLEIVQQINLPCSLDHKTWITADHQGGRDVEWFNILITKRG